MIKKVLSVIVCLILICLVTGCVGKVLANKSSVEQFEPFLSQQEDFDVLFFGTSHVQDAILPMYLWKEYGIVSYNMGTTASRIPTTYWGMKMALEHTSPRLIVMDCAYVYYDQKINTTTGNLHKLFDAFPLSTVKTQAVFDLCGDLNTRFEMLFPLSMYHVRWNDLAMNDFHPAISKTMGNVLLTDTTPVKIPTVDMESFSNVESRGVAYLQKIADLCREKNIDLLLTFIPFKYNKKSKNDCAFMLPFSQKNGLPYLDGNMLDTLLNDQIDYANSEKNNSHVNWSGALKLTSFIGRFIKENYDIPDRRRSLEYDFWNTCYADYRDYIRKKAEDEDNMFSYLLLAFDPDTDVLIELNSDDCFKDPAFRLLFENVGGDCDRIEKNTRFVLLGADHTEASYLAEPGETWAGNLEIRKNGTEDVVCLSGHVLYSEQVAETSPDISITMIHPEKQEAFDSGHFTYSMSAKKDRISSWKRISDGF